MSGCTLLITSSSSSEYEECHPPSPTRPSSIKFQSIYPIVQQQEDQVIPPSVTIKEGKGSTSNERKVTFQPDSRTSSIATTTPTTTFTKTNLRRRQQTSQSSRWLFYFILRLLSSPFSNLVQAFSYLKRRKTTTRTRIGSKSNSRILSTIMNRIISLTPSDLLPDVVMTDVKLSSKYLDEEEASPRVRRMSMASLDPRKNSILALLPQHPDPDASRTVPQLIESRGFKSETHELSTEDGFILVLHRIVNPLVARRDIDPKPVLLGHGIAAHAGHWLINSPDGHLDPSLLKSPEDSCRLQTDVNDNLKKRKTTNNLGFLLANLGYDVWLANWRGNRYSNRHKKLTVEDADYWNFTLDDMVDYDLPTFIKFILETTKKNTLAYVGMSQGSNVMFGLLSSKPSFNGKVKPFIALCPAVRISNAIRVPLPWIKAKIPVPDVIKVPILRLFNYVLLSTGSGPLLPFMDTLSEMFSTGTILQHYFDKMTYLLSTSFFDLNLNRDRLSVYTAQANFCLTKKNLAHLVQFIIYDEFAKFDYGLEGNERVYGRTDPPDYDLGNITNRTVSLIYSDNDEWASVEDFESISTNMKVPLFEDHLICSSKWSHYDFTFGTDVGSVVNEPILDILSRAERIPDDQLVSEKY